MRRVLALATLFGTVVLAGSLVACSDDASVGAEPDGGSQSTGGTAGSPGSGGTATGGSATGGSATGGSAGTATGGTGGSGGGVVCGATLNGNHLGCNAMDATGDNNCFCMIGYGWDGSKCAAVTGCECHGADCQSLFDTIEACEQAHSQCSVVHKCGDAVLQDHTVCGAMDATGQGACNCVVGFKWNGGSCDAVTGCECVGADCGHMFQDPEACAAAHSACPQMIQCGASLAANHTQCAAMNATGQGDCYCLVGYAWNGSACQPITGCECVGPDCLGMYQTTEACEQAHSSCHVIQCGSELNQDHTQCTAMDATGQGGCSCLIGYAWNGSACETVGGCECVGADCASMYETSETCAAAHASCGQPFQCGTPVNGNHQVCAAMDATGQGACYCVVGYVWNGTTCAAITGCECVGADCAALFETPEACQTAHANCS